MTGTSAPVATTGPAPDRPVAVTRVAQVVWLLVLLGAVIAVLAAVLDDEIIRSTGSAGVSADDTRVPPSFTPVVVVLDVVVSGLLLVLLAFVLGGHGWARHCLAFSAVLVAVSAVAVLVATPPVGFVVPIALLFLLLAALLHLLYRPEVTAYVAH